MLCGKGNTSESKYEDALSVLGKTPNWARVTFYRAKQI